MKAKKRPAPPRKCQMSCLKMLDFETVGFSSTLPVIVAEQLAVLVHVPRLRRRDVGVLLFLHEEDKGGDGTDQAASCSRRTSLAFS